MHPYFIASNLLDEIQPPEKGILSHTLHSDDNIKIILFAFAAGQELTAHTAPMPATLHFLRGEATVTLGADARDIEAGALIHMQPKLMHAVVAKTPMMMLLFLIKAAREQ